MQPPESLLSTLASPDVKQGLNAGLPVHAQYELGFAVSPSEVEAIQRLRFQIFNIELNEGLVGSHLTGLDQDKFDKQCHHLFVKHIVSDTIVGTYRLQTKEIAQSNRGFYSSTLFDFRLAPPQLMANGVELGRACIHADHRSLNVLFLLWKGLGHYAHYFGKQFLFGCCSLTSQNERDGLEVLSFLETTGHMHPEFMLPPLMSHRISIQTNESVILQKPPKLMRAYLSMGAKICSLPAIDRSFKTIDFLALFDVKQFNQTDSAFFHLKK